MTEYVLLKKRQPFLAPFETQNELIERGEIELVGTRSVSWLGVPFQLQGGTTGLVAVQSYTEGITYEETDKDILIFVSTQIASAIDRVQAVEREEKLTRRQDVLMTLGQQLTSEIQRSEQEILRLIHSEANQLTDVDNMYVALYDEQTEIIRFPFRYENGEAKMTSPRKINREQRGRTEEILLTGDSIFIQTKTESEMWYQQPGRLGFVGSVAPSWIGVPIRLGKNILGVIATYHLTQDYVYNLDDLEILQTMANLAAFALENARLYGVIENQTKVFEEVERRFSKAIIATDIVHRMNNLAGMIPFWTEMLQDELCKPEIQKTTIEEFLGHIDSGTQQLLQTAQQLKASISI